MAMINVNRQTNDMFYRYKMPKLLAKVEGTGNGIKTVVVNATAIAKALNRPTTYVTKFFGCELGAQVQMNAKEDRYIVNGAHDCEKLQNLLDGFIKRFVLCPHCDNPETNLSFRKRNGGEIHQVCAACGYQGTINMASHKLTTYIAKNPPDAENKSESAPEPKVKGKSKSKKNAQSTGTNRDSDEGSPNEHNGKSVRKPTCILVFHLLSYRTVHQKMVVVTKMMKIGVMIYHQLSLI
jgi:translation initiation factor 5